MMKGKKFAMVRKGLIDHLGHMSAQRDATSVFMWALLATPFSGPERGCVVIHQAELGLRLNISRSRVSRALKWLTSHPRPECPYLVRTDARAHGRGARYYIRNFDGDEPGSLDQYARDTSPTQLRRQAPNATEVNVGTNSNVAGVSVGKVEQIASKETCSSVGSDLVAANAANAQQAIPIRRARLKNKEEEEQRRSVEVNPESLDWIIVKTLQDARDALTKRMGLEVVPQEIRERVLETGMRNLEMYRIGYEESDSDEKGSLENVVPIRLEFDDLPPVDVYDEADISDTGTDDECPF